MLKLGELNVILGADDKPLTDGLDDAKRKSEKAGEDSGKGFGKRYAGKVGDGTKDAQGKLAAGKDAMVGAASAIGLAAGAAVTAGLVSALNTERAEAKFRAQIGGSREYAKELGAIAGRLYAQGFGESLTDGLDAIRAIMASGLLAEDSTDKAIEDTTRRALALSDAFGVDVKESARAAGQMIRTGMARDAQQAFDILTRGFQQTGDLAGDLIDTVNEYSTQWRKLGLDGVTAMGLLSQGIRAGARDLDIVADALKEFAIRAVDGSATTAAGFKAIGLDAGKMASDIGAGGDRARAALDLTLDRIRAIKDPVKRAQVAVALFGTQAEDLGKALYALDPSKATLAMGKVTGAADQMANTLEDTAAGTLERFKREVQGALVEKMAAAVPYLEDAARWMQRNQEIVKPLAAVMIVLGGTIIAVTTAMKIWTAVTAAYTAVQWLLNVAMTANPIGLIIVAIALLVVGIILLWKNSAGFREFFIGMWGHIWGFLKAIGHWFSGPFVDFFKHAWKMIVDRFNSLVGFIGGLPGRIASIGRRMWQGIVDGAKGAVNAIIRAWNAIDFGISVSIPSWVPGIGGSGFSIPDIVPDIPYLAAGGDVVRAGMATVGERGIERVFLPAGARVQPLDRTGGTAGVVTARLDGEIVIRGDGILTGLRSVIAARGGNVQAVLGS